MKMLDKLAMFVGTARKSARIHSVPFPVVLAKMLYAAIFLKHGALNFALFSLAAKPVSSFGEYLRNVEVWEQIQETTPDEAIDLARDKLAFYGACVGHRLPTPEIVAYIANPGTTIDLAPVQSVADAAGMTAIFSQRGDAEYFFKPATGAFGEGVGVYSYLGDELFDNEGVAVKMEELYLRLSSTPGGYIVQPRLRPHAKLQSIMSPDCLGTIRVVTIHDAMKGGQVWLAFIKLPVEGNIVDNFRGGTLGNLVAPVNVETGVLGAAIMFNEQGGYEIQTGDEIPNTVAQIDGYSLDAWAEVKTLAEAAANKFSNMPTVGWDIGITKDGPTIIEANTFYYIDMLQVIAGRGLRREFVLPFFRLDNDS